MKRKSVSELDAVVVELQKVKKRKRLSSRWKTATIPSPEPFALPFFTFSKYKIRNTIWGILGSIFHHNWRKKNIGNAILIMDNVPFHKKNTIIYLIWVHGHRVLFLPPYWPFLNPIEEMFNQWKSMVNTAEPEAEDELYSLVKETSSRITATHCSSYFNYMESYLGSCMKIDN